MSERQTAEFAQALQEVTSRAELLVREEIELAKAEVSTKISKLAKGVAVGAAAGVFLLGALIYGLHALSWLLWRVVTDGNTFQIWVGFAITTAIFLLLGLVAGFLAYRWVKKGSPPTPDLAIAEAQLIRETMSNPPGPAQRNGQ